MGGRGSLSAVSGGLAAEWTVDGDDGDDEGEGEGEEGVTERSASEHSRTEATGGAGANATHTYVRAASNTEGSAAYVRTGWDGGNATAEALLDQLSDLGTHPDQVTVI